MEQVLALVETYREDMPISTQVAIVGFLIGVLFGIIAHRTRFCTMGGLYDIHAEGNWLRFRAWILAAATAIIATQAMQYMGWLDLSKSFFLAPTVNWASLLLGGFVFGIGMVLASGCGMRMLVRMGTGDLRAFIVVLIVGVTGYMTLRGILSILRTSLNDAFSLNVTELGYKTPSLADILQVSMGLSPQNALLTASAGLAGLMLLFCFLSYSFRRSFRHIFAGLAIGLLAASAWWATGVIGNDEFDPVPVVGLSFIAPTGNMIQYLMTYTGATITFSIASVMGVIAGAFISALLTFRNNGIAQPFGFARFESGRDLARHILGGTLMGVGAVMALGCTVGQSVTGVSTLAVSSLAVFAAIILGALLTFPIRKRLFAI